MCCPDTMEAMYGNLKTGYMFMRVTQKKPESRSPLEKKNRLLFYLPFNSLFPVIVNDLLDPDSTNTCGQVLMKP
jgi:hypothetical protein